MDACHPKALFERIVGARQARDVVALKQTRREVLGDVTKMRDGLPKRSQVSLLSLHLRNEGQVAFAHLCPGMLLLVVQNLSRLAHQLGSFLHWWPQRRGRP